jgi:hypothetical protein
LSFKYDIGMEPVAEHSWYQSLLELLANEEIEGFALIGITGRVERVYGNLANYFPPCGQNAPHDIAHAFATTTPPLHYDLGIPSSQMATALRLYLIRADDSNIYAVSHGRQHGISIHQLSGGPTLVVSFAGRAQQRNVPVVHSLFRQRRPQET